MGRIIDFFKIIGTQHSDDTVTDNIPPEEKIRNLSNLTEEQKHILIESLIENDKNAKKLYEETTKSDKSKNKYDSIEQKHKEKYIPVKDNSRKSNTKDERI